MPFLHGLNTTVPGGAYQDQAGGWHDAEGRPLSPEQQAAAEKHYAELARAMQGDPAEQQALRGVTEEANQRTEQTARESGSPQVNDEQPAQPPDKAGKPEESEKATERREATKQK